MKRFFLCLTAVFSSVYCVQAVNNETLVKLSKQDEASVSEYGDSTKIHKLEDVLIIGSRAGSKTPIPQTNLDMKDIRQLTVANYLPQVLEMTPSLVATYENGTASGNSSFRIRGTDANRINVTLNGIPLNEPESQEVFWVDLPDLTSALQSVQVQRGAGTSTNGTGAFGASINMATRLPGTIPYLESATTAGSYGTFQQNIAFGTGRLPGGLSLDCRYSNLSSDGYIRNGWLKHESFFATANKQSEASNLQFNYIYGSEHTGITWEGISEEQMKENPRYNPAGEIKDGIYYDNESDNYLQHHFQTVYSREMGDHLMLNAGLNYTYGYGFYEQYEKDQEFASMGIPMQKTDGKSYSESDLVIRKYMENDYYVANVGLRYEKGKLDLQAGTMYSLFDGDHYATIQWAEHNESLPEGYEWARNNGRKVDANTFVKAEFKLSNKLNFYADMQYRFVDYRLKGIDDDDMMDLKQSRIWNFFNPKGGLFWQIDNANTIFASVAVAHREPARADIKDSHKNGSKADIKAEKLVDWELGYNLKKSVVSAGVNLYFMKYKDQLVPTGKLNEVGYKLMSNIDNSYRAGVELMAAYQPFRWIKFDANSTISRNRVVDYTAYYETYDNSNDWNRVANQQSKHFAEARLPFSPELIAAGSVTFMPWKNLKLNVTEKYVDEQYVTNTQNDDLKLPAYNSSNASISYGFNIKGISDVEIGLYANNLLSKRYACNAWGYEAHFANGDPVYIEKGLYPVAPRNYLCKFTFSF